jgi:hypothetical protein
VRVYGPGATVARDLEPEAVATSPDSRTAWVSLQVNNALAVVDLERPRIASLRALGSKDHGLPGNGLDANDGDGEIGIRTWPLRSFYQPDLFAAYEVGGRTYLVTPNEGELREFEGFDEVARVAELRLDPAFLPAGLRDHRALGRMRVTVADGDTDGDGEFEALYTAGARSFATWDAERVELLFDSGDDFERITARAVPGCFNCADDEIVMDARSNDRGPEPEAAAVGRVGSRH